MADVPPPLRPPPARATTRLRIRYCECDPMGVAHHASYIPWLEIGRTELLRESGVAYTQLEAAGLFLVITRLEVRYRRPARYDDQLDIITSITGSSRVKIEHTYEVRLVERAAADLARLRDTGEDLLATAATTLASVDGSGRVIPLPEWLSGTRP